MLVFHWFITNIVDPNFAWTDFTRVVYVTDKQARAGSKTAKTSTPEATPTTPVISTIAFSADVLLTESKHQATPPTPGTTDTIKPHKLWKLPFAAASNNSSNMQQLQNTYLILASSNPLDVKKNYRKLVAATNPADIDLIPFTQSDPDCALWKMNLCADIVFEMNDALALRLDHTGTLNPDDETINILYQKHIIDSTSGILAYAFLHVLLKKVNWQLNEHMPTPPYIEQATSICSFGSNLVRYYLQLMPYAPCYS
jgi:hypothetical protein